MFRHSEHWIVWLCDSRLIPNHHTIPGSYAVSPSPWADADGRSPAPIGSNYAHKSDTNTHTHTHTHTHTRGEHSGLTFLPPSYNTELWNTLRYSNTTFDQKHEMYSCPGVPPAKRKWAIISTRLAPNIHTSINLQLTQCRHTWRAVSIKLVMNLVQKCNGVSSGLVPLRLYHSPLRIMLTITAGPQTVVRPTTLVKYAPISGQIWADSLF